ncbi:putative membrane protein YuiB [Oceanobacillus oncorhynchi subsp. incaldanensis]|uniref:YuiB family protein n=1 Tax=Oceanobacillus oncorhynchi TaxID=545501 RepID=UPI001B092F79|nr:YuiB family protein [Oceanobacillus oncorhynchi]GIO19247.1 putative membrane protein YuiB [Oceanobacillus oncorhynchi subsp. incaldanensis]
MVQLVVSVVLYFVIFFGIAFILNMLLRKTWLMACLYPILMIFIIDNVSFFSYFTSPGESFSQLGERIVALTIADIVILLSGFIGTIVSGLVIRFLRKSGYQMF